MAHELATTANGHIAMFYTGEPPWHRLGTKLDCPPTAAEAIAAAGLGYQVETLPVFAAGPRGPIEIPSLRLNVRADTLAPLGVVSDKYKVVQNCEAFAFLDGLAAGGEVRYHTAGALGRGERIWLLAQLPGPLRVRQTDDLVEKFLLLYNSHDASSALRCLWTPTRVVCWNTCSAALRAGEGTGISVAHTGDLDRKAAEARRVLGLAQDYFAAFGEGADLLAGRQPTRAQLDAYFEALYPDPAKGDPARAKSVRMTLHGLFAQGMGQDLPGVRGPGGRPGTR
jgi:phage/plasmid-like protein (TIGR03299 family)